MKTKLTALIAACLITSNSDARADLIITLSDLTVTAGQESSMDVLVSSDGSDTFQNYFLDFIASPDGFFQESAIPAPQLISTAPDYIFFGNSDVEDLGIEVDFVSDLPSLNQSILTVADGTLDPNPFDLINPDPRTITLADGIFLLARLNFIAPTAGTFDIELDLLTSGFFDFDNFESAIIDEDNSTLTATITATAAVPEPSTTVALLLGTAVFAFRRRKNASKTT